MKQLANLRKRQAEEAKNPKPKVEEQVKPVIEESKETKEQPVEKKDIFKDIVSKPNVEDVSPIDDHLSGPLFRAAEDPYEGKSFAEVLREKREALDKTLKE